MLRGNRFRLVTLGRLTLVGADGEEDTALAKRRFKLALLTVLAMARRPLPRDALIGMFWGEQDEARARHSLSNALSSLRRALGQGAITTRDADVALAGDLPLDVDALELTEAAAARDTGRVVELYCGPFLDGVHIDDSPTFEQWVSRERRRLEALFNKACAQQCEALARARRWPECRSLAARWVDTGPLSADAALFLLNAIKAAGTRVALAEALEEYEQLRARLDREFELAPEPVVRDLAARIREQLASVTPEPEAVSESPESAAPAAVTQPTTDRESATAPSLAPAPRRSRALWRVAALAAVGVAGLAVAMRGAGRTSGARPVGALAKPVIALLAMDVRSRDSANAWLADGLPQLIAGKLANSEAVDVVPLAQVRALGERVHRSAPGRSGDDAARDVPRRGGATLVARGVIGRDGANVVLDLTVHDVRSGNRIHSAVLTRDNALALADQAAVHLLTAANVRMPGPTLAELETSSLDAYRHYMRAVDAGGAGRFSESLRELDAAIALDSGFITAIRARMSSADTALLRKLREAVRRHPARATEFDRLEQEVRDAHLAGEPDRSEALGRELIRRYPRDPRAYHLVESVLMSHGHFDEAAKVVMQAVALDSLAMQAGMSSCVPCIGFPSVVNHHWLRANYRDAAEWARRWIRARPDASSGWAALAWTYSYSQRPDSAIQLMERATSLSGGDKWGAGQFARMLLVARRYEAVDSAIKVLKESPESREMAYDLRVLLERERGRFRAATTAADSLVAAAPGAVGYAGMMQADNLRMLGDYVDAARRSESPAHASRERHTLPLPSTSARAFCWHHALAADADAPTGDTITLRAHADTLERGCVRSVYGRDWRLYHHVRGLIAMHGGRYAEAEREFEQAVWTLVEGWSRTVVELARAQRGLGRPRDAIATLRTAYATRLDAMARYVPISELDYWMAVTFAEAGEPDSARVYAGHVRNAWRDADPEIRRLLARLP